MTVDLDELERLFELVRETNPDQRQDVIDVQCRSNDELKRKLEELLIADETHDEILDGESTLSDLLDSSVPRPGREIGPYVLEEEIGAGGMATVYRATQRSPIQRQVALKVVRENYVSKEVIGRFEAEKQLLATIDHPYVTKIFDAGVTEDGLLYFSMEFIEGKAITEFCDERQVGLMERVRLVREVCEGIEHAHQQGIIHRDIKPSNVLVRERFGKLQPKIIDFGIAKALNQSADEIEFLESTRDGTMIGTPKYMSPEQADMKHDTVDCRSDVYSLGVLLHELIVGETPLGSSIRQLGLIKAFEKARNSAFPTPIAKVNVIEDDQVFVNRKTTREKLVGFLKSDLQAIIVKAISGDPDLRYQTTQELSEDLERFCSGRSVQAAHFNFYKSAKRWFVRNKLFASAALLIFFTIVCGSAFSLYHMSKANNASRENVELREKLDVNRKGLSKANYFRQKVRLFADAKVAYERALNRYLMKHSWVEVMPEIEIDSTLAGMRPLLEGSLETSGLGPINPSRFSLDDGVITLLKPDQSFEEHAEFEGGPFPSGFAMTFSTAPSNPFDMFESPEHAVFRQNNEICQLIYEHEKKMLGCCNEVIANTCEIWAQYLIGNEQYAKARKLVVEARNIRESLGYGRSKGQICFDELLEAKCLVGLRNRSKVDVILDRVSTSVRTLKNIKHKQLLNEMMDSIRESPRSTGLTWGRLFLRNWMELVVRAVFLP